MLRLSIIVPFYNVEQYIEQCIRSLYDQDIPQEEYEVICVDDCSPDGSRAIVERLQKEYPTLHLIIHERNKKLGGARNTGLKAATGRFVMFVDSDDFLLPNSINILLSYAEENKLQLLHFDSVVLENGIYKKEYNAMPTTHTLTGTEWFFYPHTTWFIHHITAWHKLYDRGFLIDNNLFFLEDTMYEDNDYSFRVHIAAERCAHMNKDVYVYRQNENSITHQELSFNHALYWIVVVDALLKLRKNFIRRMADRRFIIAIEDMVRWILEQILIFSVKFTPLEVKKLKKQLGKQSVLNIYPICTRLGFIRYLKFVYF